MSQLKVIASVNSDICATGRCPTVYELDSENLVVQGFLADDVAEGLDIPSGEGIVRIPRSLIESLIEQL